MKGFSLLETIVAIAVLILGILGPLSLASYTLSQASLSENQIIAYFLAEEALEFVINMRDSNVFAGRNWLDGLDDSGNQCDQSDGCYIDVTDMSDPIKECPANCDNIFVRRDSTTGLYNHKPVSGTNINTIFRRRVLLDPNIFGNNDEARVEVIIYWQERFASRSFTVTHHIFKKR